MILFSFKIQQIDNNKSHQVKCHKFWNMRIFNHRKTFFFLGIVHDYYTSFGDNINFGTYVYLIFQNI